MNNNVMDWLMFAVFCLALAGMAAAYIAADRAQCAEARAKGWDK